MMLKQSIAVNVTVGPFVDDSDGKTAETGLTISQADCQLSKNSGAFAQKNDATAATHLGNGFYKIPLNATDTGTLGDLMISINEGGALPVWRECRVLPANVYDSLFGGSDALQVDAVEISGDSTAADNLEAAADGTGYNLGGGSVVAASVTAAVTTDAASRTASQADVSALATSAALAAVDTVVDAIKIKTDALPADPAGVSNLPSEPLDAVGIRTAVGLTLANLDTQIGAIPTVSELNARTIPSADYFDPVTDQVDVGSVGWVSVTGPNDLKASTVGLATGAEITALQGHGDTSWITAVGFSTHSAADVVTAMQGAADDFKADVSGIGAVAVKLDTALELDGAVYRWTENALEQAPSGTSTGATAEEVWTYATRILTETTTGSGANAITIQVYDAGTTDPVQGVRISAKTGAGLPAAIGVSDAVGQIVFGLDDGVYSLLAVLAGYSFAVGSVTVAGADQTVTIYGTPLALPIAPTNPDDCRLSIFVGGQSAADIYVAGELQAWAEIKELPHKAGGRFWTGQQIYGSFDADRQEVYWEIIQGATVQIRMKSHGINARITVPASATADLDDLI